MGKDSALDRFWGGPREHYTRSFLLPKGRNGKKPKKELGADGKLVEPDLLLVSETTQIHFPYSLFIFNIFSAHFSSMISVPI